MPIAKLAFPEDRREDRDEVHYRTRAAHADGRSLPLLVVNLSPRGFMARCESPLAEGDALRIMLAGLNNRPAQVRWSLGGRIGCEFDDAIPLGQYYDLLKALMR